jgi:hypothetical protein
VTRLALVGLLVLGVAGAGAALVGRPASTLRQVDVSRAAGSQNQVALSASADGSHLLAASNSLDPRLPDRGVRVAIYTSADGGSSWRTLSPDRTSRSRCSTADASTALSAAGREVVAFVARLCSVPFDVAALGVDVVYRRGPTARWSRAVVAPISKQYGNDKPSVAIDSQPGSPHRGRIYIAWSRWRGVDVPIRIALSSSDDGGRSWTQPRIVAGLPAAVSGFADLSVGPGGALYLSWTDDRRNVFVARSVTGGASFAKATLVARALGPPSALCGYSGVAIRAQPRRCITTDPSVVDAGRRVYVTWTGPIDKGARQDVFVRGFSLPLAPLTRPLRVVSGRAAAHGDRFHAAMSYDAAGVRLWLCFYDTSADPKGVRALYSCVASRDGVRWTPVRPVASVASNETVDDALDSGYGDYEGLAAAAGVAHPIWTDSRLLRTRGEEIFTTTLTAAQLGAP